MAKVDRNQSIFPSYRGDERLLDQFNPINGIPLRLEIAARLMAGLFANEKIAPKLNPAVILEYADGLIEAHNQTCGDADE